MRCADVKIKNKREAICRFNKITEVRLNLKKEDTDVFTHLKGLSCEISYFLVLKL